MLPGVPAAHDQRNGAVEILFRHAGLAFAVRHDSPLGWTGNHDRLGGVSSLVFDRERNHRAVLGLIRRMFTQVLGHLACLVRSRTCQLHHVVTFLALLLLISLLLICHLVASLH